MLTVKKIDMLNIFNKGHPWYEWLFEINIKSDISGKSINKFAILSTTECFTCMKRPCEKNKCYMVASGTYSAPKTNMQKP